VFGNANGFYLLHSVRDDLDLLIRYDLQPCSINSHSDRRMQLPDAFYIMPLFVQQLRDPGFAGSLIR
jgi:hypothetical protein